MPRSVSPRVASFLVCRLLPQPVHSFGTLPPPHVSTTAAAGHRNEHDGLGHGLLRLLAPTTRVQQLATFQANPQFGLYLSHMMAHPSPQVCVCVCVCVCVSVCERERERERVCVCVCVSVWLSMHMGEKLGWLVAEWFFKCAATRTPSKKNPVFVHAMYICIYVCSGSVIL